MSGRSRVAPYAHQGKDREEKKDRRRGKVENTLNINKPVTSLEG
jgi:hypothetical protein